MNVRPGPVAEKMAADLAWLSVPDLSDFTEEQIQAEVESMFSKSGLFPEWVVWLKERVNELGMGIVRFEPGRTPISTSGIPIFATEAHLVTPFRRQALLISRNEPYVEYVDT